MRRTVMFALTGLTGLLLLSAVAQAKERDASDYPLRVQIIQYKWFMQHNRELADEPSGQGVANIFERGQPQGFQFAYTCGDWLTNSIEYETVPARWKKRGRMLEVLIPKSGKSWETVTCDLDVTLTAGLVFLRKDGDVVQTQAAVFKKWMDKYNYDPENGKDVPTVGSSKAPATGGSDSQPAGAAPTAPQ